MASAPQLSPAAAISELAAWIAGQQSHRAAPAGPAQQTGPRAGRDPQWVILIDGRSGSGKTHFAAHLMATLGASSQQTGASPSTSPTPGTAPQLVHLEDFYPGWGGLFAAARMLAAEVLQPNCPGFRRWDWVKNAPAQWQPLDPGRPLIVEGVGALSPESLAVLRRRGVPHLTLVMDAPTQLRKQRALGRDPYYAPWWAMWAAQERAHIARRPAPDLVVANGPARIES
ncbi:hypothetical protein [Corynebacterium sp.]|uniref:hypothetical protein n=1 Tax=Corynebacterium sp. TaxID=1720 RepID=UPI002622EBC2|nr:hypothetical protein [Corynebacterium sp.]